MMLGDVVAEKSRRVIFAQQFEAALIKTIEAIVLRSIWSKTPNLISLMVALCLSF